MLLMISGGPRRALAFGPACLINVPKLWPRLPIVVIVMVMVMVMVVVMIVVVKAVTVLCKGAGTACRTRSSRAHAALLLLIARTAVFVRTGKMMLSGLDERYLHRRALDA